MNFSFLLLEFLNKHGRVNIPGFGTFYLKNINAAMDNEGESILPPGKEIAFDTKQEEKEDHFAKYIAEQRNTPLIDAEIEIKKQTNSWNLNLAKEGKIEVENIGTFSLEENQITFFGNRTENLSPDFYGLEEINLSEIKNFSTTEHSKKPYQFSKTIYWLTPLVLGVVGLSYFAIFQPETIFGKKSFGDLKKEPVQKNKIIPIKKDTLITVTPATDSIKADSIKPAVVAPKTPTKKWSSKNHSNSKWKNQKKRQNH